MSNCNDIITLVYNNKDLISCIRKVKPTSIQDDLRQEIALSLMNADCDKLTEMMEKNNLIGYAIKVCWIMATSKTSQFYYKYKKSDLNKAINYLHSIHDFPSLDLELADHAKEYIKKTYTNEEVQVFQKYTELRSGRIVADQLNIPVNKAYNIINKIKTELKCYLLQ